MSQRHPIQDATARRTFYQQLSVALLIPAGLLMAVFMLPVLLASATMTQGTYDACTVRHISGTELRVVSETYRQNTVTFYLRQPPDDGWQRIMKRARPYQVAQADCSLALFLDDLTLLYQDDHMALVDAAGDVSELEVAADCEVIRDVTRTDDAATVHVICDASEMYQLHLPHGER